MKCHWLLSVSCLVVSIFFGHGLSAQSISGTVVNEDRKPLSLVTVTLFKSDSSLVKAGLTNQAGYYTFSDVGKGIYTVEYSHTGLARERRNISVVTDSLLIDTIVLRQSEKVLEGVTVKAEKPLIETKIDRIVVNIDGTILGKGNTVLDLLKKSPGVSVDASNNIMLNGKAGVTILMDDKGTNLSPSDLNALLSSMPSESVQAIEIIANPSSKYEAAGNAGIINIIIKKRKTNGYSIATTGSLQRGTHFTENISINHTQKINRVSLYNSLSLFDARARFDFESQRYIPYDTLLYKDSAKYYPYNWGYFYRGGIDYQLTKKITIGGLVIANLNKGENNNYSSTIIDSINQAKSDLVQSHTFNKYKNHGVSINLYADLKVDTLGQAWTLNLDHGDYYSASNGLISNSGTIFSSTQLIESSSSSNIHINSVKLDYVLPFKKTWKFEAGLKSSVVETRNSIIYKEYLNGMFYIDSTKTNQFHLNENINAVYGSLSASFKKNLSAKIGFRVEQTNNTIQSLQLNKTVQLHYIDLFPTVFVDKKLDAKNDLNFSYGRRISRPTYQDLNPFIYYNNPYSYYLGNPFLKAQYSDNFTIGYSLMYKYFASLNYMIVSGVIVPTPFLDTVKNIQYSSPVNLDRQRLFYLSFSIPVNIRKWWSVYSYLNLYYGNYQSNYLNGEFNVSKPTAYLYHSHKFLIGKSASFELQLNYDAPQYYGFSLIKGRLLTSCILQKSFLKNKALAFTLVGNDIFKKGASNSSYHYLNLIGSAVSYYDQRYVRLSVTYTINKLTEFVNANRRRGSEEEQNRVKSQ